MARKCKVKVEAGLWRRGRWLLGVVLIFLCVACQPRFQPTRPAAPPPPPPPAPKPAPQLPTFFVSVGRLNLRAGPGMDFPKLHVLERNEEVEKVGEMEDWFQVRVKKDGTLGWVASRYLSSKPVTAPLEPPTAEPAAREPPAAAKPPVPGAPRPPRPDTVTPRAPKPAEAAEPPVVKPPPAEPTPVIEPVPAKPAPPKEEPPAPPSEPPAEKPSRIRIM